MAKKKPEVKLSLSELLGREGAANVDLHKDNPKKRELHVKYRTPRDRVITSRGMEYTRPLAGDVAQDMRYHELAREFVNNGFDQTAAYATVYGTSLTLAKSPASILFNTVGIRQKIREMMLGTDGEAAELPKEYLIERLMQMIDNNVLDYMANDGTYLNVTELRALPLWVQQQIKRLSIVNQTLPVAVKDADGAQVLGADGEPKYVEVRQQHITLELHDKIRAMDLLAKAMRWITSDTNINVNLITSETMVRAEARIKQLRRDDLEGTATRLTTD